MIRAFVAIAPPEEARDALSDIQTGLPRVSWTPEENLHLTLLFVGAQPRRALEDFDAGLAGIRVPPFELELKGVGAFGKREAARALFAGLAESAPLRRLQAKVAGAARDAGLSFDERRFAPHVTLARLRGGDATPSALAAYAARHALFEAPPFLVESFALIRSDLSRTGARYETMAEYPLAP